MKRSRLTREDRKAKTRDELIAAATRLFAFRGFQATTLDDIAEAAGFTKGAIYANFPNKRALFEAVLERHVVTIDPAPLVQSDLPLSERLAFMGRALAKLAGNLPRETVLLDIEARLDALRNPRSRRRWDKWAQQVAGNWPDVPARFEAVNTAQGARPPFSTGELLGLMGILGRGIIRGLAETPGAVTPASIETLFRLLSGAGETAS